MAQGCPESPAPGLGDAQLAAELAGLRQELAELRRTVAELVAALAPAGPLAPGTQPPGSPAPWGSVPWDSVPWDSVPVGGGPDPASTADLPPAAGAGPEVELAPGESRALGSSPSALLARRNAERLAGEVQRRLALAPDPGDDTELDLLIDRLHDLALARGPGSPP